MLLFGIGEPARIALGACLGFLPIAISTVSGLSQVDLRLITAMRSMGASQRQLLLRVRLPGAFGSILSGLRIGFFVCFASVIAGEMIASDAGLGYEIAYSVALMNTARMFASHSFNSDPHDGYQPLALTTREVLRMQRLNKLAAAPAAVLVVQLVTGLDRLGFCRAPPRYR